jgi:hypothetical protein
MLFVNERGTAQNSKRSHQSQTVCLLVGPGVFNHIPVGHPFSENAETVSANDHGNAQQRQDIRMVQMLPADDFSA